LGWQWPEEWKQRTPANPNRESGGATKIREGIKKQKMGQSKQRASIGMCGLVCVLLVAAVSGRPSPVGFSVRSAV
jgi:hypothetical protein